MSEVHFTYNGLEGTIKLEDIKTEEELHHKLCVLFNLNESIYFTGIKNEENDRVYSLQEIVNTPSLFAHSHGSIIIGPLSPKSFKKSSSAIENLFKYVFSECNNHGLFKYLDYFVLRVLYNRKSSYFTFAVNLLLDGDYDALSKHLHTLVLQVKDTTAIKMDILRLITFNMQMNKEITYEHVNILLSLIGKEDGLICSAYNQFEETDDLAQLKDSLLRILVLMVKPERFDPKERDSALLHRIENRGSWVRDSTKIDINMILNELNEAEIIIYTLFELGVVSDNEASQLLQIVSETPTALHSFIKMIHSGSVELMNHELYSIFLSTYHDYIGNVTHPLYYPFHTESYPTNQITQQLLFLEKNNSINRVEYILLYKRCMMNSPALRHCYSVAKRNQDTSAFINNIHLCLSVYNLIKPTKMNQMEESDALIFEEIIVNQYLHEDELAWLFNEYNENNEVIMNAFSVCKQTGDMKGLLSVIHSIMQMYSVYQEELEAKQFLLLLIKEMVENNTIKQEQASILSLLVQEGNECVFELYEEYKKSNDFEGLLSALIYISLSQNSEGEESEGEICEEEELSLPSLDQALDVINQVANELSSDQVQKLQKMIHEGDGVLLSIIAQYIQYGNKEWFLQRIRDG